MTYNGKINCRTAEILLALLVIARATAYMFSKLLLQSMGQFTLLGVRSSIAFLILIVICFRSIRQISKNDIIYGSIAGAAFFVVMCFELAGLAHTSSVSISFEENTAVVFVPVIIALIKRKLPDRKTVLIVLMCTLGIVLLNFRPEGFEFNIGDFYGMMSAVTYALTIIIITEIGNKADPVRIGIVQVGMMALLSMVAAFIFECPSLPSTGTEWGYMLYLAVVCTAFGFTLQPYAQSGTTAERAAVICALNPAAAAVLGGVFLGETLTVRGIIGAILIMASIIL